MKRVAKGFTLIELMLVIMIIGLLAAIAIPRFAALIRKSAEGSSKGNLGSLRSAMSIYYGDMQGVYPSSILALTINGKYLTKIPLAKLPNYHLDSNAETLFSVSGLVDDGGWEYINTAGNANVSTVFVACTHTDSSGALWTSY